MSVLLVKAIDAQHSDPHQDRVGCYKVGDPVLVKPDGWEWGRLERLPRFMLVHVPGVPCEVLEPLCAMEYRWNEWGRPVALHRRRRHSIDLISIGGHIVSGRRSLARLEWGTLKYLVTDKLTGRIGVPGESFVATVLKTQGRQTMARHLVGEGEVR